MKVVAAILLLACAASLQAQAPGCSLVPGWKQQGPARSFTADNLFEYMDGNAEGYIIYRFVKMQGVNCEAGDATLVFDVSEMADPEWAYGMFAANRDPRVPGDKIGMAGQVVPRKAIFVKDKYFVEVSSSKEQPDVLRSFAQAMEKTISGRTALPDALAWFPPARMVPDSTRMVPESVLGMRVLKRGWVAQYDFGKAFLVPEETPESAAAVMNKLRTRIAGNKPAKLADEGFEANDKYLGKLCIFRKGRYVGGFTGLKEGEDVMGASNSLAEKVQ